MVMNQNYTVYIDVRISTIADSQFNQSGGLNYVRSCTQAMTDILAHTEECGIESLTEYMLEYATFKFNRNECRIRTALDILLIGLKSDWIVDAAQSQKLLDLIANSAIKLESLPKVKISLDRVLAVLRAKCL